MQIPKRLRNLHLTSQHSSNVKLEVKEDIITPDTNTITLISTNSSDKEYSYGEQPFLGIFTEDEWHIIPYKENVAWNMMAYILLTNDIREHSFNINYNYNKLKKGNYRIVKELSSSDSKEIAIAEFKVQ